MKYYIKEEESRSITPANGLYHQMVWKIRGFYCLPDIHSLTCQSEKSIRKRKKEQLAQCDRVMAVKADDTSMVLSGMRTLDIFL